MTDGIKNLTVQQKDILYSFIHYHGCVMLYNIPFEYYCLNNGGIVKLKTANSLIKRNVLKLRGFCIAEHQHHKYVDAQYCLRNELPITEEVKVQIALGTIEPAWYTYRLDHKYFDTLKQIV